MVTFPRPSYRRCRETHNPLHVPTNAYPEDQVLSIMTEESLWHFDPEVFKAFLRIKDEFRAIKHEFLDQPSLAA